MVGRDSHSALQNKQYSQEKQIVQTGEEADTHEDITTTRPGPTTPYCSLLRRVTSPDSRSSQGTSQPAQSRIDPDVLGLLNDAVTLR